MQDMEESFLIINADDLGWSCRINEGIVEAHISGILTSATLIANGPATMHAMDLVKEIPTLDVGVHLNYHFGRGEYLQSKKVSSRLFRKDGSCRFSLGGLWAAATVSRSIREELYRHFKDQIEAVLEGGLRPSHLDTHKHLHLWPPIFELICRLASEYNIRAIRVPVENPFIPIGPLNIRARLATAFLGTFWYLFSSRDLRRYKLFSPQRFVGITQTGFWTKQRFVSAIKYAAKRGGVTEIMVHPGYVDDVEGSSTRLLESRLMELRILKDNDVRLLIEDLRIRLVGFSYLYNHG